MQPSAQMCVRVFITVEKGGPGRPRRLNSTQERLGEGLGWNSVQYLLFILVWRVGEVITSSQ